MSQSVSLQVDGADTRIRIDPGRPGTTGGLRLRLGQFALSFATICIAATIKDVHNVTIVKFLLAASMIQCIWSLSMAMVDAHTLLSGGHSFSDKRLLMLFLIGDGVITLVVGLGMLGAIGTIMVVVNDEKQRCNDSSCYHMMFASATSLSSAGLGAASYLGDMMLLAQSTQVTGDNDVTIIGQSYSKSGLALRVLQLLFSVASSCVMLNSKGNSQFMCFEVLIIVMPLISIWSFLMIVVDSYGLWMHWINEALSTLGFLLIDLIGWSAEIFSIGTCWGTIVLFMHDRPSCHPAYPCGLYLVSVVFAGIAWISLTISSSVNLWIYAKIALVH